MPNNSATVIINGHGSYSKTQIYNVSASNHNFLFPTALDMPVSNTLHNHLLCSIRELGNQNYLTLLENFPSTYRVSNSAPPLTEEYNLADKHTRVMYKHNITPADNVAGVIQFQQMPNTNYIEATCINSMTWGVNGRSLRVQYNKQKIEQNILNAPPIQNGEEKSLLPNDVILIKPTCPAGHTFSMSLKEVCTDGLANLKFPVIYRPAAHEAHVLPPFLDNNLSLQNKVNMLTNSFPTDVNDMYCEVIVSGDSNIIWDACRDMES